VYKVVRSDDLGSLGTYDDHARVTYAQGQITRPNDGCGPLCAYDAHAAYVIDTVWWAAQIDIPQIEVWEAEAEASSETTVWTRNSSIPRHKLPAHTVLCESITLLRRVWPAEEEDE